MFVQIDIEQGEYFDYYKELSSYQGTYYLAVVPRADAF